MFKDGIDTGYRENPRWWWEGPEAFRIADLDKDYPPEYFPLAEPPQSSIDAIIKYVPEYFQKISGKKLRTIIEFGSGGGWYLKAFQDLNYQIHGFEGSAWGVRECLKRGVTNNNIEIQDFRHPVERKFLKRDIALCTEVAEHIPPPFAATLIKSLIDNAHMIWFSAEPPGTNQSHLHHMNEQPIEYWISIFEFYGFGCFMLPDEVHLATIERGRCIFYNKKMYLV